jgi:hypothetical protein
MVALPAMDIIEKDDFVCHAIDQAQGIAQLFGVIGRRGKFRDPDLLKIAPTGKNLAISIDNRHLAFSFS